MTPTPAPDGYEMSRPCQWCATEDVEWTDGVLEHKNGQDTVRCTRCRRHCYNASRTETGRRPVTLATRDGVTPKQRAAILRQWGHRCFSCHIDETHTQAEGGLHLAHLISREHAARYGILDHYIDDPINLVPMCAACNLGERTLPPRAIPLLARAIIINARWRDDPDHGGQS